jgi:predicted anti-sigma-YlaC factor YlaD
MNTRMPRSCVVHRAALLDFVDGQPRSVATTAALAHLGHCRTCEDELAGIVRTVAALRRLGRAASTAEPPAEAWPMLRERIRRPSPAAWRWRFSLGGLMVSTAAVAVLTLGSLRGVPVPVAPGVAEPARPAIVDRHYDPAAGRLTPGIVNAIAGGDVSARARLRSAEAHVSPSSVDRDEHDAIGRTALARPDRGVLPTTTTRS